jgi:hypothetical protein
LDNSSSLNIDERNSNKITHRKSLIGRQGYATTMVDIFLFQFHGFRNDMIERHVAAYPMGFISILLFNPDVSAEDDLACIEIQRIKYR